MLKTNLAIAVLLILAMSTIAFAGPNGPKEPVIKPQAVVIGTLTVTGTQTVAETGECSYNEYNLTGQVEGTVNDGGGMDNITFEVWDDGALKDSETISIPVGETQTINVTLSFEGLFGTGNPGVGLYCPELNYEEDPFYPTEVQGRCPSEATVPTLNEWGMIVLSMLIATIAVVQIRRRNQA